MFGAFYGGFVAIAPSLAADYFGGRALGSIIGALYSGVAFGALLGSPVAGYAFDLFGSYTGVTWPAPRSAWCRSSSRC